MAGKSIGSGRTGRRGPAGGIAEQGRLWARKGTVTSRGKNAHIGWALRSGSWRRCVAIMTPHLGEGAKGWCALRFHESVPGQWPGSRANRGKSGGKGSRIRR